MNSHNVHSYGHRCNDLRQFFVKFYFQLPCLSSWENFTQDSVLLSISVWVCDRLYVHVQIAVELHSNRRKHTIEKFKKLPTSCVCANVTARAHTSYLHCIPHTKSICVHEAGSICNRKHRKFIFSPNAFSVGVSFSMWQTVFVQPIARRCHNSQQKSIASSWASSVREFRVTQRHLSSS